MSKITPIARKNNLVIQEMGNEILIYDLKTNKALSLNETSGLVWQLSNGDRTISQIAETVTQKLNFAVKEDFVWLALEQLKKENLLENEADITSKFQGASRREVIRKIGFASLVTLPMISTIIAPTALQAQSGNSCSGTADAPGCGCTAETTCASNCCGVTTAASLPRFCVPFGGDSDGAFCRSQCECASTCCGFGAGGSPICVTCGSVAPGNRCRINRECASGLCGGPGGTCS